MINNLVENADRLRCFELGNDLLKYYGDCLNMISDSKGYKYIQYIVIVIIMIINNVCTSYHHGKYISLHTNWQFYSIYKIAISEDFYKQSIDKENILMSHVPTNFHLHRTVITQENSPGLLYIYHNTCS